jgi:hypothetical protein
MKKNFAVGLLLMAVVSIASVDRPGIEPVKSSNQPAAGFARVADGSDPPVGKPATGFVRVADGSDPPFGKPATGFVWVADGSDPPFGPAKPMPNLAA